MRNINLAFEELSGYTDTVIYSNPIYPIQYTPPDFNVYFFPKNLETIYNK